MALFLYLEASAGPTVYFVLCVCSLSDIQCTIWANAMDGMGVKGVLVNELGGLMELSCYATA
jgi:hypothetical protein